MRMRISTGHTISVNYMENAERTGRAIMDFSVSRDFAELSLTQVPHGADPLPEEQICLTPDQKTTAILRQAAAGIIHAKDVVPHQVTVWSQGISIWHAGNTMLYALTALKRVRYVRTAIACRRPKAAQ